MKQARPRTSEQRQIAREKAAKGEKIARVTGGQDVSERQWSYLCHLIGTMRKSHIVRYVEFANQIASGVGTLDRFTNHKVFLSRIYFIRAIDMAKQGYNELTTTSAELAAASFMTEQEWLEGGDMFSLFDALPDFKVID